LSTNGDIILSDCTSILEGPDGKNIHNIFEKEMEEFLVVSTIRVIWII